MFSLEDKEREATEGWGVGGWGVEEERKDKLCMPQVSIVRPGVLFRASCFLLSSGLSKYTGPRNPMQPVGS